MSYEQTAIQAFEMIERWMRWLGSASNHRDAADRATSYGGLSRWVNHFWPRSMFTGSHVALRNPVRPRPCC